MNFFNKIKNNKGSAESAMFVFGLAIFATIVVFSMDIFGLTWQRYLSTRELSNMSRLYAIRATDLYIDDAQSGVLESTLTTPDKSDLGSEMMNIMKMIVAHGKISNAVLTITKDVGGIQLLRITAENGGAQITAAGYDQVKTIDYGDVLIAELKIEYNNSTFKGVGAQQKSKNSYVIQNKFAFEDFAHDGNNVG